MSSRRILFDVYKTHSLLLVVALFSGNCCYAQTSPNCERPSPSCGNIHNISNPFRLKGDPENCGNKKYELECDHNRLVLYLSSSVKYYVHSINYNNYTIRLVDVGLQQGNCSSLPLYSLSDLNFTTYGPYGAKPYSFELPRYSDPILSDMAVALWVDCEKPVKSPFYTDGKTSASSCIDKATSSSSSLSSGEERHYSYFLFGSLKLSDVADQCKIDEILITTFELIKAKKTFPTRISTVNWSMGLSFPGQRPFSVNNAENKAFASLGLITASSATISTPALSA